MKRLSVFFMLYWTAIIGEVQAQQPFLRKLGYNEGLPTQVIYDLFVSKEGYLYMGTEIGLIRYNGIEFIRIPITGNLGNSVNILQEDGDGNLWCMNFSNQLFKLENDTLKPALEINNFIAGQGPLRSFVVVKNTVWIVTDMAIFAFNSGNVKELIRKNETDKAMLFVESYYDGGEMVYVTDPLNIYQFKNEKFVRTIKLAGRQYEIISFKGDVFTAEKNNFSAIYLINRQKYISANLSASVNSYLNRFSISNNKVWLCTNTGLFAFNNQVEELTGPLLKDIRITDIVQDKEGGQWISSVEKGLYYMPSETTKMKKLSEYNLSSIAKAPNNTHFVGTGKGSILWVDSNAQIIHEWQTPYFSEIEFIFNDSSLNRIITSHGYFIFKGNFPDFYPMRLGKRLSKDDNGNYLLCLYNKAVLFNVDFYNKPNFADTNTKNYLNFGEYFPAYVFRENRSRSGIFHPQENRYYFGYSDNLFSYDTLGNSKLVQYNDESVIASDMIIHDDGTLIAASMQHGLVLIKNNKVIGSFSRENGLSSNTCKIIRKWKQRYFVITDEGLDMIDLHDKTISNLSSILSLGGLGLSDLDIQDSKIWITTNEGLITFPIPDAGKSFLPDIISIKALAKQKNGPDFWIQGPGSQSLKYNQNDIRIEVNSIHFQSSGNFNFQYRLLGYDSAWHNQAANNSYFSYLSLPSGSYTFEVRTLFNNFPSEIHRISFSISKPVWKTSWFIFLMILFGFSLLFILQRYSTRRLKKKQLVNEKLLRSQITALRSQMNPHFMFNVLNSVQGLIFSNKKNEASAYLGKFSALMRNVLDFSDKPSIPIRNELEMLRMYLELEAARFENDFTYEFIENLPADYLDIPIPSMIIQPYIENSVKHGLLHKRGEKKLIIRFSLFDKNGLRVEIEDNGIGRLESGRINERKVKHKSFATQAIDSRIHLINKALNNPIQIQVVDKMNKDNTESLGTKVIIDIPVIYE